MAAFDAMTYAQLLAITGQVAIDMTPV